MIRKIALGAALVIGSMSGAFAFNNVGEIESPYTSAQGQTRDTLASARRALKPAPQMNQTFDHPADVSNY